MSQSESMEREKESRLLQLLNQSTAANILQEHGELNELIHDYFMDDPCDESDDEVTDEEEEPMDENDTDSLALNSDGEFDDPPLVHVQEAIGGESCFGDEIANHPTHAKAAAFKCKCKQIKVAAEAGLEPNQRRGCISQFTDEEVVALQLSIQEMTKGKTS